MAADETVPAPEDDDKSSMAFQELMRVLEGAARAGIDSVGLEWKGADLQVFHNIGNLGLGVTKIAKPLQLDVIAEIVQRAHLGRKHKGNMPLRLLGQEYSVTAEEYDSFGESAYILTLKKRGTKRAK